MLRKYGIISFNVKLNYKKQESIMMTNFKNNIKKLSAVFFTMIVISIAMVVSGCGQTVIDIKESRLLKVELEGFDGNGTAVVSVNESKLKALKKEYIDKDNYGDIKEFLDELTFEMENPKVNGTLSNGDKFNVVAKYDKELAEEVGVVLENTTIECLVGDKLPTGTAIDVFKGVKVEYSGDNGNGHAYVNTDSCDKLVDDHNIYFEIEGDNYNLKNGDKIVVCAKSLNNLEDNGYFLKEETKEFTVEGLTGARETFEGVAFNELANYMYDELEDYIAFNFLEYTYKSGKKRDLNSFEFKCTSKPELVKYAYAYDEDDVSINALIAYYKVTTDIECVDDQYGYEYDEDLMKKGEKDTGVSYVAMKSNPLKVKADNTINVDYIYFDSENGRTVEECNKLMGIEDYKFEYYDKDYKKIDGTATTDATELATEKAAESAKEKTTTRKED